MDLLFHILLKTWILQDLDILKTSKLVKENLFTEAFFISAAVSPVPSSRHPYGISSINQFLSFLLFCYRCLRVILCLYCPYCSHTIPQQQYSKILQQRTHQPHSQLNLWHAESFSRFTKVCVTALCILITDHTFNLVLLHVLFRGPCHVSLWTTSLINKGLFRSSCKH